MAQAAAAEPQHPVSLWVYDLTNGMARALSPMLLGQQIEGVWHTSVVVHDTEWFFGYGVQHASPGSTPFGAPVKKLDLGVTGITPDVLKDLAKDLGNASFKPEDYNLISNNCNHFTDALATLLVGSGIPAEYLTQHEILLKSPMGQALAPMLQQMEGSYGSATAGGFQRH